jgi:hypothetical protein
LLSTVACGGSSPAQPSGGGSSDSGASLTAPRMMQPAAGAQIRNSDQPITLTIQNAVVTRPATVTYRFEVASESTFGTKVQTKDSINEGANGQTSVKLDSLPAGSDYYWRARASIGGTPGPFAAATKFTIGPAITINAPVAVSPTSGSATGPRPTLTVNNATRTGPSGPITYVFEIADNSGFSPIAVSASVAERIGQTASFTPTSDLVANKTYFWRVTAVDQANGVSSPPSTVRSFVTSLAIDLASAIVSYPIAPTAAQVAAWPQTARIIAVEQDGAGEGAMCISFSTSHDWPSAPFFGDPTVPVYANQWYFANIGGQWYAGPGEYLRADRAAVCKNGQGTTTIGPDGGWRPPMNTWVPKPGELVGYMISTPARNWPGLRTIDERSNIVVQPWHDSKLQGFSVKSSR